MCRAFSCIITKDKKVFWKLSIDSHNKLITESGFKDSDDTKKFVRCEVSPKNGSYLTPDEWIFKVDEQNIPRWFSPVHKELVMDAFKQWKKQLYNILIKDKPIIHPFRDIQFKGKITVKHKLLLKEWDSVRDSVWDSVWDSVRGYTGSFFRLKRKQWKYTEEIRTKKYPFQPIVDLWNMGLLPSFDGTYWRLHAGEKTKIVFKIKQSKLIKIKTRGE